MFKIAWRAYYLLQPLPYSSFDLNKDLGTNIDSKHTRLYAGLKKCVILLTKKCRFSPAVVAARG